MAKYLVNNEEHEVDLMAFQDRLEINQDLIDFIIPTNSYHIPLGSDCVADMFVADKNATNLDLFAGLEMEYDACTETLSVYYWVNNYENKTIVSLNDEEKNMFDTKCKTSLNIEVGKKLYQAYKDSLFEEIIDKCDLLKADETFTISDFGANGDLTLHFCKDCDYDREVDEDYSNLVMISTKQNGKYVDDTESIYVTDGELWKELERLWDYKDFCYEKEDMERE